MADEMRSAYLIAGTDEAKIDAARGRLRVRAEAEGGPGALEVFEPTEGRGSPSADDFLLALPAMSLSQARRYLLVDGIQRWRDADITRVAGEIATLPPDLTIVLIARGKAPAKLAKAVKAADGDVREYETPRARDLPRTLISEADGLGFRLEPAGARMLVERMGANPRRLSQELCRLALWARDGGEVTLEDLEEMVADTSETAVWALSDALLDRDRRAALEIAERLLSQGENVTSLIYGLASRLRKANEALAMLESGKPAGQVEKSLGMHPYAARQLVARLQRTSAADLRAATGALADLELWCRGGADYGDEVALTLAINRAAA